MQIEELVLRIPGISAGEAAGIAHEVAKRVQEGLPLSISGTIPELNIRLEMGAEASKERIIDAIAGRIVQQILYKYALRQ